MEKPLVLFDGNAIIHRAYHAFRVTRPPTVLTVRKTGEIVTAVYGFAQMVLKAISDLNPSCCAIAFDTPEPTFRHEMFDRYKANRPPTPDELIGQFDRVRDLVGAFNIPVYELPGYEADDVLGSLSRQAAEKEIDTVIVTGDADAMQLVSPHVNVIYPRRSFSDTVCYDEKEVREKYGVTPRQIIDLKALVGDNSDNIPGVPGIGEKTAVKLINQLGSLEEIYERIDEVNPPRIQSILKENREIAFQSKQLATIDVNTPVTLEIDRCQLDQFDRKKTAELFRELEFFSLLSKMPDTGDPGLEDSIIIESAAPVKTDYHTITDNAGLDSLLNTISSARLLTFDLETSDLNAIASRIVGFSFSVKPGEAFYVPVGHFGWVQTEQLPLEAVLERLRPVMEDPALEKIAHNAKFDMTVFGENGVDVANVAFDTMIAAHLMDEKSLALKNLAFSRLGMEMTPITDLIGKPGPKQLSMSQVDVASVAEYSCADSDMTMRLAELYGPELKQTGLWELFANVEMPLVPVLVTMERNGVALDTALMAKMAHNLGEQLLELEGEIYRSAGHQFNINSPKQLGPVLFEELGLPTAGKRKGNYSTAASILESLRGTHLIIEQILEYRQLAKMKSTYIDALPGLVNLKTGRVHTSFNQTRTSTGRLSSSEPNLQNIPVRGELAMKVREAFIAQGDNYLLSGDYSQIDLRALAHLSRDDGLVDAFRHDEDIHSATAARLFGVSSSEVTQDMRRLAKTVNFGVIYGMSEYGLEQATEMSREEASKFIMAYFEQYPGIKQYMEATKKHARELGYVQTILGRRRSIPEINSSNRQIREAAERMAINMPVQGTSADIIKVAMIHLHDQMKKRGLRSKMLLQVHDELLFEVIPDEIEEIQELVPGVMCSAMELIIPLKVDINMGRNWAELKH